jgi:two-component system response regulator WspF
LPQDFPAAILIAQHIDKAFARNFTDWLARRSRIAVEPAIAGQRPVAGKALVSNSNDHLILRADGCLHYSAEPRDYFYRPSVDLLFNSVALHWPGKVIGVLLSGMGHDGANGLLAIKLCDMPTIVQSKDSCVVFGMPKSAINLGAADSILDINEIGPTLISTVMTRSTTTISKQGRN